LAITGEYILTTSVEKLRKTQKSSEIIDKVNIKSLVG